MKTSNLPTVFILVVTLALTSIWFLSVEEPLVVSEAHIYLLPARSGTSSEAAFIRLRVRARLPAGQLQQELSRHKVNLQKIFDEASITTGSTPTTVRKIRRRILSELRTVPVTSLSWDINPIAKRQPDQELLKLLEKSPGTLGYVESDAER